MSTDLHYFLIAKAAAGLSANTLIWYEKFVSQFLAWAEAAQRPIKKPETAEAFLASLRQRKLSANTISGCYRALSVYFKWLVQRGRLRTSPLDQVQAPRTPKQRKRHVTIAEFNSLYRSITGHHWLDHRDRAMLLILFYSGLRANELLALQPAHVDLEHDILKVVNGKGGSDRDVPYMGEVSEQLAAYLAARPPCDMERLFVASGPTVAQVQGPLTYGGLSQMVRRRCALVPMPRINLHAFRHGYAMLFLNEGEMELGAVSQTMGHSSVDLTRRFYADFATTALRQRYNAAMGRIEAIT